MRYKVEEIKTEKRGLKEKKIVRKRKPKITKEFIDKNFGKDRVRGRPIRLNRRTLKIKRNKDYAELLFFGDVHLGYPTCNIAKAKDMLDYALDKKVYVIGMGDMIEAGLKDSIGDSMYRQKLNPQRQMEIMVKMLEPVAKEGLLIGLHMGNHEQRITKNTGIDISKLMAKLLNVPYLRYSCWSLLSVDGQRYSLYSTHGSGGSKFKHTKLKAVMDIAAWINSDIIAFGHVHSIASEVIIKQKFSRIANKIVNEQQYVCLTGSYMEWDNSYAQDANMPITKLGSPKAKIFAGKRDVHFSF